ncbi:MAG: alpha/beta fold hydrolase [Gammaproteobacteria bacterium]
MKTVAALSHAVAGYSVAGYAVAGLALALNPSAWAGDCDLSPRSLRAGADTDVVVCGDDLPAGTAFDAAANADIIYVQPLERCGPVDKRGGFHLVLNASRADIGTATVAVTATDGETNDAICSGELELLPARDAEPPAWLDAMPDTDARFIDVDGIRTRYFELGSGPAIVLVHGGMAGGANNNAQKWEQNFAAFARTHRVIALDRLAQGGTGNLSAPGDYADYFARDARHLEAFLDALDVRGATLVGHSQGGWPVTAVALRRPDLVGCLVNVDTVMVPDDMAAMQEALAFMLYAARYVHPPDGPTVPSARRAMALRYPSGNNITTTKAERVVAQHNDPKSIEARKQMATQRMTPMHPTFRALKENALRDIESGDLDARSLVIWGEFDPQVPLGLGEQLDALLIAAGAESEFVIIDDAGHAPFIEYPDRFNELVIRHCAADSQR